MDYLDQQILMKLKENARQSASDISKEIHLSVSTVIDRIRKMESSGVIESYTVITDEKKTGSLWGGLSGVSKAIRSVRRRPSFRDGSACGKQTGR